MHILTNFSLTELRYIVSVAKENNFNKAAQKCFVSQPTLSIAIKKLEDQLGVKIFERNKKTFIITDIGEKIITKAQQILEYATEIQIIAKENQSPYSIPLKIGAIHTVGPYLFPVLIKELNNNNSKIKLFIEEDYTNNLYQKLKVGELDAIIIASPFEHKEIKLIELYSEPLELIIPNNHSWINKSSINSKDLINQTILLLGQGNCFRDAVLKIWPKFDQNNNLNNNKNFPNIITTTSFETIKCMVTRDLGISIMPKSAIIENNANYISKPFNNKIYRNILIAYRNNFSRINILNEIARIITNSFPFNSF